MGDSLNGGSPVSFYAKASRHFSGFIANCRNEIPHRFTRGLRDTNSVATNPVSAARAVMELRDSPAPIARAGFHSTNPLKIRSAKAARTLKECALTESLFFIEAATTT